MKPLIQDKITGVFAFENEVFTKDFPSVEAAVEFINHLRRYGPVTFKLKGPRNAQ